MTSLTNYITEKLITNQRFDEKLIINKNYNDPYTCAPKSFKELRKIIKDRYDKLGPGTEKNPIDFNDIDVRGMTTFYNEKRSYGIFEKTEFEYIDISNWNVSNVEDMSFMFYKCEKLKFVGDLSDWVVSSVHDMYSMFDNCKKLTSVGDLSDWDVSGVKSMKWMFNNSGITNIPSWYNE